MNKRLGYHFQRGFSLVELMISTMLGLMLSSAILSVAISVTASYKLKMAVEELQENISLAAYFIRHDMSMIGFKSCFNPGLASVNNLSLGAIGKHLTHYSHIDSQGNQYQGSDAISFITLADTAIEVSVDMPTVHSTIDFSQTSRELKDRELLITNCQQADLFYVTDIWRQRFSHDTTSNSSANLSVAYQQGSLIYPLSIIRYKLAKGVSGQTGLYRQANNDSAQELISNVKNMRVTFITYNAATQERQEYTATDSFDYLAVVSIKIQLLLTSSQEVLAEKSQYIDFNGKFVTSKDRRLYKSYSLFISLNNVLAAM